MVQGVEHPHPIKAALYELSELLLDDPHLMLLLFGTTPHPTILLLRPPTGEHRERCRHRIPDVELLPVPPLVGVIGEVHGIRVSHAQFSLQGKTPHRCDLGWIPHHQGSPREQPPEEIRMRLHPEESLTDSNEAGDVQHPRWIKVLQLQTPLIKEPTQEPVCGVP